MAKRKNGNQEATKIHLVNVSPNYGAAGPSDNLKKDPFGENYQEDTTFWEKVSTCFKRLNGKINRADIEFRLRLERIKVRLEEHKKDTLIELITNIHDNFKRYVEEERKKGKRGDAPIFNSFVKQVRCPMRWATLFGLNPTQPSVAFQSSLQLSRFVVIILREDYNGHTDFPLPEDKEADEEKDNEVWKKQKEFWEKQKESSKNRKDTDRYYGWLRNWDGIKEKTSVLHLAAQRNLTDIAKYYVELYPGSVVKSDEPDEDSDEPSRNPIEWALFKKHDDVCSTLIKATLNERVRSMFEGTETRRAEYRFHDMIREQKMKKTILAVLDSCVNPDFPFIVQDPEQKTQEKEAWSKMGSTLPLRYHFYFQLLDGDDQGKPAKIYDDVEMREVEVTKFRSYSPSVFQLIADYADSSEEQDPIKHMAVRQLIRYKWEQYGEKLLIFQAIMYVIFLIILSLALGLGATTNEPTSYQEKVDRFRGFCEVMSILFSVFYMCIELEQFIRAPLSYLKDGYNILDFVGTVSILVMIPCRYAASLTVTRSVAVVAFFINFFRIFKFFPIHEEMGTYAKTFNKIIVHDIKKFAVVLAVVLLAFAGSVFLALAASQAFNDDMDNFWNVLLQEIRAIAEGKEFADSYSAYHWLFTLFIISNMFMVIVVLSNILIGQISFQYSTAQMEATIQNDIDRAKLLTGLDRSILTCRKRIEYYVPGIFVNDQDMIKDLITDWNALQQNNTVQKAVKEMLEHKILKKM